MSVQIPDDTQVRKLWDKYYLPDVKRNHMQIVARVADRLAHMLRTVRPDMVINGPLLHSSALLHDIDKNIPRLPGEHHPDTAVRVLREEGYPEVANVVKTHSLNSILNPDTGPRSWVEKLLYLSDKMVKHEVIGVEKRFELWNDERLPKKEQDILDHSYPEVKKLETEIFGILGITPEEGLRRLTE